MPYKFRQFTPGLFFHAYSTAISGLDLYLCKEDCSFFLRTMEHSAEKFCVDLLAWDLMPDHFHMVLRQLRNNLPLSLFFNSLKSQYTRYYNRRYCRFGHLFSKRYDAKPLHTDRDIHDACRYVHANPVIKGLVNSTEDWPFSNITEFSDPHFWKNRSDPKCITMLNTPDYSDRVTEYGLLLRRQRLRINPAYTHKIKTALLFGSM